MVYLLEFAFVFAVIFGASILVRLAYDRNMADLFLVVMLSVATYQSVSEVFL